MFHLKKRIPIWIKEPLWIFLSERKKIPIKIAYRHAACNFTNYFSLSEKKRYSIFEKCHKEVINYLMENYESVFYCSHYEKGKMIENAPIWLFWWQGEESAPELVKKCILSVRKNAGKHPVIVLSEANYNQYVDIPDYILEKLKLGIISLTHFSDILRVNLLADRGGFWLDSTLFCKEPIKEEIFKNAIFTCRNPQKNFENVSHWLWTGYAIYSFKNNTMFCKAKDFFNEYWRKSDVLIDYFLIDYVLYCIYMLDVNVKKEIDSILPNNIHQTMLHDCFNLEYSEALYEKIMKDDTWLFKLSWKEKYMEKTQEGHDTIYNFWKKEKVIE